MTVTTKRLFIFGYLAIFMLAAPAGSSPSTLQSFTPQTSGGTLLNFEGQAEGTLVGSQSGVTFSQVGGTTYPGIPVGTSRPQIDNSPALFGYGFSSGSGALTGSTEGGFPFPTVAGIRATFATPMSSVEVFFSDTSALGTYTIKAFSPASVLLESIVLGDAVGEFLPPGYAGGSFPPPGTFPLPGVFVGFSRPGADIGFIEIGPGSAFGDAYAIDDLRFSGAAAAGVPEPGVLLLLGSGLTAAFAVARRRTS